VRSTKNILTAQTGLIVVVIANVLGFQSQYGLHYSKDCDPLFSLKYSAKCLYLGLE